MIVVCICKWSGYTNILLTQQAAERWQGDSEESFAQVSIFVPESGKTSPEELRSFGDKINTKLIAAGMEPPETGALWSMAGSGTTTASITGDRGTSMATVVGITGNFSLFHPYEMLSGSFLTEDDLMDDRVVLDYELAWKLFGASSLEGMSVKINGKPYYVAGVARRETDGFTKMAYTDENPMIFMSYSAMTALDEDASITCIEIACADPITGYAKSIATEYYEPQGRVVENSARYDYLNIISYFTEFGKNQIQIGGFSYPYWENAARVSEAYVARLLLLILLLSLYPLFCLIWLLVELIKTLVGLIKLGTHQAYEAWDDRYARMAAYEEKREEKKLRRLEEESEPENETGAEDVGEPETASEPKKKKKRLRLRRAGKGKHQA